MATGTQEDFLQLVKRARAHYQHGDWKLAAESYRKAAVAVKRFDEPVAITCYEQSLELNTESPEAYNDAAILYVNQLDLNKAKDYYRRAIKLRPDFSLAKFNLSLVHLMQGDFKHGWELYENRLIEFPLINPKRFPEKKRWKGQKLSGKRLLVLCEQGFGDAIQFVRFIKFLKKEGAKIILHVRKPLKDLFETLPDVHAVTVSDPKVPPADYDYHYTLLSLASHYEVNLRKVKTKAPYLSPPERYIEKWKQHIVPSKRKKIGIVWKGESKYATNHKRSCGFDYFKPLIDLKQFDFYSLQKDEMTQYQLEQIDDSNYAMKRHTKLLSDAKGTRVHDLNPALNNFADTAAAMMHLDLIITIDTAVAHLGGALGIPTWILLPYSPDWRWLLDRDDSPWYPSVKLFRQTREGDWLDVFKRVHAALEKMKSGKKGSK